MLETKRDFARLATSAFDMASWTFFTMIPTNTAGIAVRPRRRVIPNSRFAIQYGVLATT